MFCGVDGTNPASSSNSKKPTDPLRLGGARRLSITNSSQITTRPRLNLIPIALSGRCWSFSRGNYPHRFSTEPRSSVPTFPFDIGEPEADGLFFLGGATCKLPQAACLPVAISTAARRLATGQGRANGQSELAQKTMTVESQQQTKKNPAAKTQPTGYYGWRGSVRYRVARDCAVRWPTWGSGGGPAPARVGQGYLIARTQTK